MAFLDIVNLFFMLVATMEAALRWAVLLALRKYTHLKRQCVQMCAACLSYNSDYNPMPTNKQTQ